MINFSLPHISSLALTTQKPWRWETMGQNELWIINDFWRIEKRFRTLNFPFEFITLQIIENKYMSDKYI